MKQMSTFSQQTILRVFIYLVVSLETIVYSVAESSAHHGGARENRGERMAKRLCLQLHEKYKDDLDLIRKLQARLIGRGFQHLSYYEVVKWLIREKKKELQTELDRQLAARIEMNNIIEDMESGGADNREPL